LYLMLSGNITQNNRVLNHYSLQVIVKILNSDNAINHDIALSRIGKRVCFAICNSCYWCASLYSESSIKCQICKSEKNVELMPISENESFKVSLDSRTGITLAFS